MKISIGLLAHNEENTITFIINQIFSQDIFQNPDYQIQFAVVANGCTDNTVDIAEQLISAHVDSTGQFSQVVNLAQAGKSNAWNHFVHTVAWQDTSYLVLVDADIEFGSAQVIRKLVESLSTDHNAVVAVDIPKKDVVKNPNKNLFSKILLKASELRKNKSHKEITGQLYCIRYKTAKTIHMPIGLPVEDGFLRAMIVTENFKHADDNSKITLAPDTCHYFKALSSPIELYKHEKRIMLGSAINSMIYKYLWENVAKKDEDAGWLIQELNANQPRWLLSLIEDYKSQHGFWVVPKSLALKHTTNIIYGKQPIIKKIFFFPIALAATLVLIVISVHVNIFLLKNNGIGYW